MPRKKTKKTPSEKYRPSKKIFGLGFLFSLMILFFIFAQAYLYLSRLSLPKLVKTIQKNPTLTQLKTPATASPTGSINKQILAVSKISTKSAVSLPYQYGRSVRVPILTYHYIGNNPNPLDKARYNLSVAPDLFEAQMKYLADNGYTTVSLDTLYAALKGENLPSKPVVLTFDDGYIDFYYNAYPILRRFNLRATSFIPTGLMEGKMYMTWNMIKDINSGGLVSFEAHSIHHYNLPSLALAQARQEIVESKKTLESYIGAKVNFFAYPYGTSNESIWKLVKDAGYLGAVGTWYSADISEGVLFDMPRIKIPGGLSVSEFAKRL